MIAEEKATGGGAVVPPAAPTLVATRTPADTCATLESSADKKRPAAMPDADVALTINKKPKPDSDDTTSVTAIDAVATHQTPEVKDLKVFFERFQWLWSGASPFSSKASPSFSGTPPSLILPEGKNALERRAQKFLPSDLGDIQEALRTPSSAEPRNSFHRISETFRRP
ncbi:hypothetical protein BRADI_2g11915v3 [Brachypodium distachyon]|uniref:Uncharacterized protein n=2 Tax=Brachypodium distachyon TaxID=15368 RepID=A0A0Q3QRP1_BRADI|nr:hypothetical protein BRADI_2g11915v3 [Brachypodium distachyon]KQK04138.1 hypothetical protein BRADI_2g11915v3 [Brachypodium distachyon]